MLPQSRTLEFMPADNPGVGVKRGVDNRRITGRTTGVQHGRWEIPAGLTCQQERHFPGAGQYVLGEDRDLNEGLAVPAAPPTATVPRVGLVDRHGNPLICCHLARAGKLLKSGWVRVHRLASFVIRLVDSDVVGSVVSGVELGNDGHKGSTI
jgi:hypothetical protein